MSGDGEASEGALPGPWAGLTGTELSARWRVPRVETWTSIGSTNDRAAVLARAGRAAREDAAPLTPTIVIAEAQSAGRGRRGRAWRSAPESGIWMSVLLPPGASDPALPLVAGAATCAAIEAVAGAVPPLAVKWPNDLLVDGRKVGGVLCEATAGGVVIGLGLNVSARSVAGDPALAGVATALEVVYGKPLSRLELADRIVAHLLAATSEADPLAAVRDALARRDALRGRRVVTETHGVGVGAGLAADGALLIEQDGRRQRVVSGSVDLAADSAPA